MQPIQIVSALLFAASAAALPHEAHGAGVISGSPHLYVKGYLAHLEQFKSSMLTERQLVILNVGSSAPRAVVTIISSVRIWQREINFTKPTWP